jgi:hypothetical protein
MRPKSAQHVKVFEQAGDLSHASFYQWWEETGSHLYVEEKRPREVRLIDLSGAQSVELYPEGESIVVEIPLTIRQGTISRKVKELVAQHHAGRALDVTQYSTARWPLHTKRYDQQALDKAYWAYLYRLLYPDISAWRIGDRLRLAPGLRLRGVERGLFKRRTSPLDRMNSTIGRYLYKARWTLWNAELGSFPNKTKIEPILRPFGARQDRDYAEATSFRRDNPSAWQLWLHQQYHEELVSRIRQKRGLLGMGVINARFLELLPKFIAGETDLIE